MPAFVRLAPGYTNWSRDAAADKLSRPGAARDDSVEDDAVHAPRAAHFGAGIDIAGDGSMSTPYRSSGCPGCGAAAPPGGPKEAPGQSTPLCEGCVHQAIRDTRRLLERLGATQAPKREFRPWVKGLTVVAYAGLTCVLGLAAVSFVGSRTRGYRQSIRSRAALVQAQTASPGDAAEHPRAPSQAAPPGDAMASAPAAWSGASSWGSPIPWRPHAHTTSSYEGLPWPPAILATAEKSVTHDPQELFARAERLAAKGADLTLHETRLSSAALPLGGSNGLAPVFREGRAIGVKVSQPGPLLASAGVESGDLVTSVNGYGYPEDPQRWVEPFLKPSGNAVVEVLRGAHRVVLSVRWREPLVK